ncbi:unnamed protein product [Heligmosomoides polygyrus]|uniref:Uncharacterized protein n=1 Tax=Heligmosomoides polygyrus TaxID=6339 RepID=A0A183F631_HELPZ|nr:unnamed protein product [Heligmosomoides polygyrus]
MYPVPLEGQPSPKMNGLRAQMQRHAQSLATQSDDTGQRLPLSCLKLCSHFVRHSALTGSLNCCQLLNTNVGLQQHSKKPDGNPGGFHAPVNQKSFVMSSEPCFLTKPSSLGT